MHSRQECEMVITDKMGLIITSSAMVGSVIPGSQAATNGILPGSQIVSVAGILANTELPKTS